MKAIRGPLCIPLNRENMGVSVHVREITKWGHRDSRGTTISAAD